MLKYLETKYIMGAKWNVYGYQILKQLAQFEILISFVIILKMKIQAFEILDSWWAHDK